MTTACHSQYWPNARVDLNPHQVDAAMFALRSPPPEVAEVATGDVEPKKPRRKFGKGEDKNPTLFNMEGA